MKQKIVVYEQVADLGSVILGIKEDAKRASFDEAVSVLIEQGYDVQRFDPVHTPDNMMYQTQLPTVCVDDTVISECEYPSVDVLAKALNENVELFSEVKRTGILDAANKTRIGLCCAVGQDVYCDPDEEELWK